MSKGFAEKWYPEDQPPLISRIREAVIPQGPLKPRLNIAVKRIQLQMMRLDQVGDRFTKRDKSIFTRIVEAYTNHEMPRANILANELAELRKMEKSLLYTRLALEQIVLRLTTVTELGDVVTELAPAMAVLNGIKKGMVGIMPQAEREFDQIGTLINGIIIDASQTTQLNVNFEVANEDAQKILEEASIIAEKRMKEKFPELPTELPAVEEKLPTQT